MRFFFYGTLQDAEVQALVLGRRPPAEPARLSGYVRIGLPGRSYPMLRRKLGGSVRGLLVDGLTAADLIRIAHFEGPAYRLQQTRVRDRSGGCLSAWVCLPDRSGAGGGPARPWSFERWQRRHKRRFLVLARAWMREFGVRRLVCEYRFRHLRAGPAPAAATPVWQRRAAE